MMVYVVAGCLNFAVNFFLLLGTQQLAGYAPCWKKLFLASAIGGAYAIVCFLCRGLGILPLRLCSIALMSYVAFGCIIGKRSLLFLMLHLAIQGIATGAYGSDLWSVVISVPGIVLICMGGFWEQNRKHIPIELHYGAKKVCVQALRDTGNTLRDPVTGAAVLVLGADAGMVLTGLNCKQLSDPIHTLAQQPIPGLRLIPYRTIDQPGGMMLGLWIAKAKVGKQKRGVLVAFAPEKLSEDGQVEALIGGSI